MTPGGGQTPSLDVSRFISYTDYTRIRTRPCPAPGRGRTASNEIRCLEAVARRVAAPELVGLIADADRRWQPDLILFESNAAFAGIADLLMRHASFGPKVKPVPQTRDKASRVHAFSVPVENGSFRLQGAGPGHVHPGQQALFDEMTSFPFGEHDDLLDAAATGTAYLLDRPEPRVW
jgi:predicted phage terminase large subunit-like protein